MNISTLSCGPYPRSEGLACRLCIYSGSGVGGGRGGCALFPRGFAYTHSQQGGWRESSSFLKSLSTFDIFSLFTISINLFVDRNKIDFYIDLLSNNLAKFTYKFYYIADAFAHSKYKITLTANIEELFRGHRILRGHQNMLSHCSRPCTLL